MKKCLFYLMFYGFLFLSLVTKIYAFTCDTCAGDLVDGTYCSGFSAWAVCNDETSSPAWTRGENKCCRTLTEICYPELGCDFLPAYRTFTTCTTTDCVTSDCCQGGKINAGHCNATVGANPGCWVQTEYKVCCKSDGSGQMIACDRSDSCASQHGQDLCPDGYYTTGPNVTTCAVTATNTPVPPTPVPCACVAPSIPLNLLPTNGANIGAVLSYTVSTGDPASWGDGCSSTNNQFVFSWGTDANATNMSSATQSSSDKDVLITGLALNTTYYWKVKAQNGCLSSAWVIMSFVTAAPSPTPTATRTPTPTATPTKIPCNISINNGATCTQDLNVTLNLSSAANTTQMKVWNAGSAESDWMAYSTTKSWTIAGSGTAVWARFTNGLNSWNYSDYCSDTIIYPCSTSTPTPTPTSTPTPTPTPTATPTISLTAKTCSISNVTSTGFGSISVTFSGRGNIDPGTENTRLYLEKSDGTGLAIPPTGTSATECWGELCSNKVGECNSTDKVACSRTYSISNIPVGNYYLHCDVPTEPPITKCSGNPFCDHEGGGEPCDGWISCSSSDNYYFSVVAPTLTPTRTLTPTIGPSITPSPTSTIPTPTVGGPTLTPTPTCVPVPNPAWIACDVPNNRITWGSVAGIHHYPLRVDASPNSWDNDCSPINSGDVCEDIYGTTSRAYTFGVNGTYNVWVHSISNCDGSWGVGPTPGATCYGPTPTVTNTPQPTPTEGGPTLTPTPTATRTPTPTPTPTIGNSPPSAISLKLRDMSDEEVIVDVGTSSNHICDPLFLNTSTGNRRLKFEVTVTDPDNSLINDEIEKITLDFRKAGISALSLNYNLGVGSSAGGSQRTKVELPSVTMTKTGTDKTVTFTVRFTDVSLWPELANGYMMFLYAEDTGGEALTKTANRRFRVWDCKVGVSGAVYDSSADEFGAVCPGTGYSVPIGVGVSFKTLDYKDESGFDFGDKSMAVTSPNYGDGGNDLIFGEEYAPDFNNDFNGSNPLGGQLRAIDVSGAGSTTCWAANFLNVDSSIVSPYLSTAEIKVDFTTVATQDSWFQVAGGGVVGGAEVNDNIPITCANDVGCTSAITIGSANGTNGLVAAPEITNDSGCGELCKYGKPNDWGLEGDEEKVIGEIYDYNYFLNNYYNKLGVGKTLTSNLWSSAKSDLGSEKIGYRQGSLTIDQNITRDPGDFLMVVVSGDITVVKGVTQIDGIFVANNSINIGSSSSSQLVVNGILYSPNGNVNLTRSYEIKSDNNTKPAVLVNFRPDFIFNMPTTLAKTLSSWKEGR